MSEGSKLLFGRIKASLLLKVLVIYIGASWLVLQIIDVLNSTLGLPTWYIPAAFGLLLIGLPIILATAMVQAGLRQQEAPQAIAGLEIDRLPDLQLAAATAPAPTAHPISQWLTWRRSILGGVLAFTALGIAGAVIVIGGAARVTEASGAAGDAFEERAWLVVADFEAPADEPDIAIAVREALTLDLKQSRYVNVASSSQVAGALRLMELPDTIGVVADLAREVAQREGFAAVLAGSISRLGDSYVLGASVLEPASGEELIVVQSTAAQARLVEAVQALSRDIRRRLGESRAAISASQPLPQVTTRSLEALRRYAQAVEKLRRGDQNQALNLAEAAIDLDPDFAMAHRLAGVARNNLLKWSDARRSFARAYELRSNLSERERLHIEAVYASNVLNDRRQAIAIYELILASYPDDGRATNNLGVAASIIGDSEKALQFKLRTVELDPYMQQGYRGAINSARLLDRWAVAESLAHLAMSRGLRDQATRWLWEQAVAEGDWGRAEAVCDSLLAASEAGADRFNDWSSCAALDIAHGRVGRATERLQPATEISSNRRQLIPYYGNTESLVQAELLRGRSNAARAWLDAALTREPLDSIQKPERNVVAHAAGRALILLGELTEAQLLADAAAADTIEPGPGGSNAYRLQAMVAAAAGDHEAALDLDRRAIRKIGRAFWWDQLYRGESFDALQQWDSAVALYEDVLDPRRIADPGALRPYIQHLPLVHRRLGEIYVELDDNVKAAEHYEAFIELWEDCDPELRPQVEAARRALQRLGAERAAS